MRKANIPIENRLKAILYLFCEKPGHPFFEKIVSFPEINKLEKYMRDLDNTGRDIALTSLEKYIYGKLNIYPFMATDDNGLIKMFQDTKPSFVFIYQDMAIPIYKEITKEMLKKYLDYFEVESPKNSISYVGGPFKDLYNTYLQKKDNFINLIISQKVT